MNPSKHQPPPRHWARQRAPRTGRGGIWLILMVASSGLFAFASVWLVMEIRARRHKADLAVTPIPLDAPQSRQERFEHDRTGVSAVPPGRPQAIRCEDNLRRIASALQA